MLYLIRKMDRKEFKTEYKRNICEKLRDARVAVQKGEKVSEVLRVFKDAVTTVAAEVVGGQRKG